MYNKILELVNYQRCSRKLVIANLYNKFIFYKY